jgi:hypothetical protein
MRAKIYDLSAVGVSFDASRKKQRVSAKSAGSPNEAVLVWRKRNVSRRYKESIAPTRANSFVDTRISGNYSSIGEDGAGAFCVPLRDANEL